MGANGVCRSRSKRFLIVCFASRSINAYLIRSPYVPSISPCLIPYDNESPCIGLPLYFFFPLWLQNQTQSKGLYLCFFCSLMLLSLCIRFECINLKGVKWRYKLKSNGFTAMSLHTLYVPKLSSSLLSLALLHSHRQHLSAFKLWAIPLSAKLMTFKRWWHENSLLWGSLWHCAVLWCFGPHAWILWCIAALILFFFSFNLIGVTHENHSQNLCFTCCLDLCC